MTDKRCAGTGLNTSQIGTTHEYEMSEILRRYSKQRSAKLHQKIQTVTTKDAPKGQSSFCLSAPVRFTRKSRPESMKASLGEKVPFNSIGSPSPCAQNKSSSLPFNDPYDDLLQKLMNGCEIDHEPYPSEASTMDDLDADQLNAPR